MPLIPETILVCPVCRGGLETGHGSDSSTAPLPHNRTNLLQCGQGHRFDAARQGYFNLLTGRGTRFEADTAEMVQARIDFLSGGHFSPLVDAVCAAAAEFSVDRPVVLDAGAGTGHYLRELESRLPVSTVIALDISKFALRRAARLLPTALCLVWDVWRDLPIADGSVDLLLNIFAPRNPGEFARVSRAGGVLIVVTPQPHHLREISDMAGLLRIPRDKANDVAASLAGSFELIADRSVEFVMSLAPADVHNVAAMGPSGHHGASAQRDSLPESLDVTAVFTVQAFRRAGALPSGQRSTG